MKRHLFVLAAVAVWFCAPITATNAQIRADTGSIAIGGSVIGSTVIIGITQEKADELVRDAKRPLEELTTRERENILLLKEKLDLNERQMRAALGILGDQQRSGPDFKKPTWQGALLFNFRRRCAASRIDPHEV
jgi:hypothetical protein